MQKHYLPAPEEMGEKSIRHLPDRSDLSKLYPDATKKNVAEEKIDLDKTSNAQLYKAGSMQLMSIVVRAILPFMLAVVLTEFFLGHVLASNISLFLPIILLVLVFLTFFLALTYRDLSKRLYQLNINSTLFLATYIGCMTLISPFLYSISRITNNTFLNLTLFITLCVFSACAIGWCIFQFVFNESLTNRSRVLALAAIISVSLALAIIYSLG